jgi:hypothetical protein
MQKQTVNDVLTTCGDGYWSDVSKSVQVTDIALSYINDESDFGELRVYFNTDDWDVREDGLIYTDSMFMEELRVMLDGMGLAGVDVEYSEQGMQGDNYVSCDVGEAFIKSYGEKFKVLA